MANFKELTILELDWNILYHWLATLELYDEEVRVIFDFINIISEGKMEIENNPLLTLDIELRANFIFFQRVFTLKNAK